MLKLLSIFLIAGIVAASVFAHKIDRYVNDPISDKNDVVEIVVDQGATFNQVSQRLVEAGFISHPLYFKLLAMYEEKTQKIKSGEYRFKLTQSPAQILEDLVQGNTMQYKLTIIEGKRFQDFYQQLQDHPKISRVVDNVEDIKDELKIEQKSLEGLFFPDTYTFSAGTKDIDIIRQSHKLLRDFLDEEWPNRSEESLVSSPYEALILASIVEKETSVESERPVIAGVFISRLKINMPLQTDPTVIYGLGAAFDGNLTRKHLQTDNPYNTYTRRGLPPSPIALVGKAAIRAVLHPDITGNLYFVSKNDGTHYFSKTYKEHLAAVRKYQLKR
ncbi:MAG: endolytic transglycosylase MltG [Gammaproteobacteria bacterium]